MVAYSHAFHGNRRHIDARALIIAVLMYVGMFVWLLNSPVAVPLRTDAAMVLVRLWQAPPMPDALPRFTPTAGTLKAAPNPVAKVHANRSAGHLAPHPEHVVVPEGHEALASSVSLANSIPESMSTRMAGKRDSMASSGDGTTAGVRFRAPRVLHRWLPPYPRAAFKSGQQGVVNVLVTIDANGKATASETYKSSGSASLDQAASAAVMRWKFRAAEKAGRPTTAQAIISVDWKINPSTIVAVENAPAELTPAAKAQQKRECLSYTASNASKCKLAIPLR